MQWSHANGGNVSLKNEQEAESTTRTEFQSWNALEMIAADIDKKIINADPTAEKKALPVGKCIAVLHLGGTRIVSGKADPSRSRSVDCPGDHSTSERTERNALTTEEEKNRALNGQENGKR